MARIVIVPGLSVRAYARPPARALVDHGHRVSLLAAPAWRRTSTDLGDYGRRLARDLDDRDEQIDLLVGLSVGTQAAAVAASRSDRVRRLLLISPTIDPIHRSVPRLLARWIEGDSDGPEGTPRSFPLGDWAQAGVVRIGEGMVSALHLPLEDILTEVAADVTVVHAENDVLGTDAWARRLARDDDHFRSMPRAPHSWPVDDGERFADLVAELVA